MQIVAVVFGVLSVAHSVNAFGLGGIGGGCGCQAPPPCPPRLAACPAPVCGPTPVCPPAAPPLSYCGPAPACSICAPPPPPPCPVYQQPQVVCLPPPPCPAPACSQPAPQYHRNDCCHKCGDTCNYKSRKVFGVAISEPNVDPVCNDENLHAIMLSNMSGSTSDSKRAIQKSAELKFDVKFNVICATGEFSYVVNSPLFCQVTVGDITCYAYKH